MPRTKRIAPGGMVFHALNRGVGRMRIFSSDRDYLAFEELVEETLHLYPMRVLAHCLMVSSEAVRSVATRGRRKRQPLSDWNRHCGPAVAPRVSPTNNSLSSQSATNSYPSIAAIPIYAPDPFIIKLFELEAPSHG